MVWYANHFWPYEIVLKISSDIEENLGLKPSSNQGFSICHCNLNSMYAHKYIKISLLRAYISTHKFYIICISETYLDSDTSDDDDNLKTAGYNLIRANHPSNTKWHGVCIYCKHSLAFRLLNIHYLKECLNFEILFGGITLHHYIAHLVNHLTLSEILQITSNFWFTTINQETNSYLNRFIFMYLSIIYFPTQSL